MGRGNKNPHWRQYASDSTYAQSRDGRTYSQRMHTGKRIAPVSTNRLQIAFPPWGDGVRQVVEPNEHDDSLLSRRHRTVRSRPGGPVHHFGKSLTFSYSTGIHQKPL